MKFILCLLVASSSIAWSKPTKINFNEALMEDVQADIQKDEERFRNDVRRGPASVEEVEVKPFIDEESKIDKKDRQIGPRNW